MRAFGEFVRNRRDEQGLSLRELSRRLGVSAAFVSDIELGRRYPSQEVLKKLAEVINVSFTELQSYDPRTPVDDLRRLTELNPKYNLAFRKIVKDKISPEQILNLRARKVQKKNKSSDNT